MMAALKRMAGALAPSHKISNEDEIDKVTVSMSNFVDFSTKCEFDGLTSMEIIKRTFHLMHSENSLFDHS